MLQNYFYDRENDKKEFKKGIEKIRKVGEIKSANEIEVIFKSYKIRIKAYIKLIIRHSDVLLLK